MHRDPVHAVLECVAQGAGTAGGLFVVEIARSPDRLPRTGVEGDFGVLDDGGRRVASLQRRQIDEWLEGRAGLAQRLGRPVVLAQLVAEAAGHGEHAAGVRIHGDDAAADIGDLPEPEGAGRIGLALVLTGDRFDQHHVSHLQRIARPLDRPAEALAFQRRPRPAQLVQRDPPLRAIGKPDRGLTRIGLQHHGQLPGADAAGRLQLGQAFDPARAGRDLAQGAAPAMAAVIGDEPVAQRLVGDRLQLRIDRGADRQPAGVEALFAIALQQVAADLFGEIIGVHHLGLVAPAQLHRLGLGRLVFLGRDEALIQHPVQHIVAPGEGSAVAAGCLGQCCEIGGFRDRQLVQRLVEIVEGRRGNPVGTGAEIDLVQIQLEDPVLAEGLLDAEGEDRLLDLAGDRNFVGQQKIPGDLLGDGGSADRPAVLPDLGEVLHHRPAHAHDVDAGMVVEILVLGGEEGLDRPLRYRRDRHEDAALGRIFGQEPAVAGVHAGHHRRLVVGELSVVGKPPAIVPKHVEGASAYGQRYNCGGLRAASLHHAPGRTGRSHAASRSPGAGDRRAGSAWSRPGDWRDIRAR